ncbi:MAG TPA: RNA methyltransferase [Acidimicrobiia bacterium]|nr:RNA methyltransferase [Acidimicrobiia bacterium]
MLVGEAVACGVRIQALFGLTDDVRGRALGEEAGVEYMTVSPEVLGKISTTDTPQSPVAVVDLPEASVAPGGRVLVAWGVGDPGNCGTLIRTAAAFGYSYLAGPGAADTWSPKVLRAASGGHFRTAIGEAPDLSEVRAGGRTLVATVSSGGAPPGPLPADVAILVGSEPHGLPPDVVEMADAAVTIPMEPGAESLNAAVAGAIVAYLGTTADPETAPGQRATRDG